MLFLSKISRLRKSFISLSRQLAEEFPFLITMPAVVWQILFCLIPVAYILLFSFISKDSTGFLSIFQNYKDLFKPHYITCLINSLMLSAATVIGCLLFCFPMAYILAFKIKKGQEFFLAALMLPWWTNAIIRIYCWFFLLDKKSLLFRIIKGMVDVSSSTQLVFNPVTIVLGTIYCYFAFMLLPLYNRMVAIPKNYVEASVDLGAKESQTIWRIIIPLCRDELFWYSTFIGFCALGEFAIPELFGGSKFGFWASVISNKFVLLKDFNFGAAFTVFGIIVFSICAFIVGQFCKILARVIRW